MGTTSKRINDRILAAELTATERNAVQKIVSAVEQTVFYNATQVAEMCGLSPTSVTRIIQKLGYAKYSEFKRDMEALYHEQISPMDMFDDYLQKEIKNEVVQESIKQDYANLRAMEDNLDEEALKAAAEQIIKSDKVFVVGMFGSEIVVKSLEFYFWRLGKRHECFTGIGLSKKFMFSDAEPGDALIAISNQRIFKEVMECVNFANENGIITLTITDNYTNPLASRADHVLVAPVKGTVFDCTHTATLALVDVLCNMIAHEMKDSVREVLRESRASKGDDLFCV